MNIKMNSRKLLSAAQILTAVFAMASVGACGKKEPSPAPAKGKSMIERVVKSDAEWKKILTPEQYRVTRKKGTEQAFTGEYHALKDKGIYKCVSCDLELFSSDTKFESGTGWPSYWAPINEDHVTRVVDKSWFLERVEVVCARCDAHLGHVFDDGPKPTGLRYCMNSVSLKFEKK